MNQRKGKVHIGEVGGSVGSTHTRGLAAESQTSQVRITNISIGQIYSLSVDDLSVVLFFIMINHDKEI